MATIANSPVEALAPEALAPLPPAAPAPLWRWYHFPRWVLAWLWFRFIGALFCMSYPTAIVVVGWLQRWTRGKVLHGWWRRSAFAKSGDFDEACTILGLEETPLRPRWFWHDNLSAAWHAPDHFRQPATALRKLGRLFALPFASLAANFWLGAKTILCTYVVTGWGCLLLFFGWDMGWIISFNKFYEQHALGGLTSAMGAALLIFGVCYSLMAQVHLAVTGEARAFFDFHFIWSLIKVRLTAYFGLIALLGLATVPLFLMRVAIVGENWPWNNPHVSDEEARGAVQAYWYAGCFLLVLPLLLLLRRVAAAIYASAVLKVLRHGYVLENELHPVLQRWLGQLDIVPVPLAGRLGVAVAARFAVRNSYAAMLGFGIFVVALLTIFLENHVGEFFVRHPDGFLNHVLYQIPCFNYTPPQ